MYSIQIDQVSKIISINLSGYMGIDEVEAFEKELISSLFQLNNNEYSIYANFERMDPVSQDSLPYMLKAAEAALLKTRKFAAVHKRTVTQMQMRKIVTQAKDNVLCENNIMFFTYKTEAMNYLNS